jgi:Ser/Thr protein kinase RdoA (MazF antagonist)
LEWIDYLAQHDVSVCVPLRSRSDRLVETIETDDAPISAVVFEKAPGRHVPRDEQTSAMTRNRGRLLGRIHALTKEYTPTNPEVARTHWYEGHDFANFREFIRPEDTVVAQRFDDLMARLRSIPADRESYGLIHTDAHGGNTVFDGDQPTLFDFDDCDYDFFISDIAIALFYAILSFPANRDIGAYARQFLRDMLTGYRRENTLDTRWLELIPTILKRREIVLYVAIHRGLDIDNPGEWAQRYIDERKPRIEDNVPVLDIDFSEFA